MRNPLLFINVDWSIIMEKWKINLYTLWGTQIISLLGFGLGIPFIPYYLQELGVTDATQLNLLVGLASTIPAAAMAVAAPIWGIISDRYGRKPMIVRAMAAGCIVLTSMAFVHSVGMFMVLRAIQGAFTGTITAAMAFVSADTPENRMSYALGLMTSSTFIGYSIGPMLGGIIAELAGYRVCFVCGGLVLAIGMLLVILLVKENQDNFAHQLKLVDILNKRTAEQKANVEISQPDDMVHASMKDNPKIELKKSHKSISTFMIAAILVLFIGKVARNVFTPFTALYVQESLGTITGAALYTGIINGATGFATAVAALTITRLGDKYNKFSIVLLLTVLCLPITILLVPHTSILFFTVLYSGFFFLVGASEPILTSALSEKTEPSARGGLFGILGTINSVALMVGPMTGASVSAHFSLETILLLIPALTFLQIIILIGCRKYSKSPYI